MRTFRRITLALWAVLLVLVLGLELVAGQEAHALGHGDPSHGESCALCVLAAADTALGSTPTGAPAFVPTCWFTPSLAPEPSDSALARTRFARGPPALSV